MHWHASARSAGWRLLFLLAKQLRGCARQAKRQQQQSALRRLGSHEGSRKEQGFP